MAHVALVYFLAAMVAREVRPDTPADIALSRLDEEINRALGGAQRTSELNQAIVRAEDRLRIRMLVE